MSDLLDGAARELIVAFRRRGIAVMADSTGMLTVVPAAWLIEADRDTRWRTSGAGGRADEGGVRALIRAWLFPG